ncbi:hypothetical protein [Candidatus Competibacter phosphatis]|uniref:hypothetical protein n=1 Tax=Candidatus Competibacter phosphatis TaxID=221280 RepID=UPI00145DAF7B|nr:hypothetical protein [Candidatus Competibacter phosphatis]
MNWTLLIALAVLWLVSPIILLIALIVTRHRLKEARQRLADRSPGEATVLVSAGQINASPPMIGGDRSLAPVDLENLLLLRLELQRLLETGVLTEERHRQLTDALDRSWARHLREGGLQPDDLVWQRRRAVAWSLLVQSLDVPLGPPPWQPSISESSSVVSEPEPSAPELALGAESIEVIDGPPRVVSEPVSIPSFQPPAPTRPLPPAISTPASALLKKNGRAGYSSPSGGSRRRLATGRAQPAGEGAARPVRLAEADRAVSGAKHRLVRRRLLFHGRRTVSDCQYQWFRQRPGGVRQSVRHHRLPALGRLSVSPQGR